MHSVKIQLRFNDADALGHVNNSVYMNYFDLGKTEYFNAVRGFNYLDRKVDIVIAHFEVDFLKSVFLSENVAVETQVTHIGNKSLKLFQRIVNMDTNELKCTCSTIMVGIDFTTDTTMPISNEWRHDIAKYENRPEFLPADK